MYRNDGANRQDLPTLPKVFAGKPCARGYQLALYLTGSKGDECRRLAVYEAVPAGKETLLCRSAFYAGDAVGHRGETVLVPLSEEPQSAFGYDAGTGNNTFLRGVILVLVISCLGASSAVRA